LKLLWLLEFLAEKVLEFFHGLSFFCLEFFGYREKKACTVYRIFQPGGCVTPFMPLSTKLKIILKKIGSESTWLIKSHHLSP